MKNIIVDTDIFVDCLRGYQKAKFFFEDIKSAKFSAHFSAVTETELISGDECNVPGKKQNVLDLLSLATKVPVSNDIALKAGDFRRLYGVSVNDAIVAATAVHSKAEIRTRNLADFNRIKSITARKPY